MNTFVSTISRLAMGWIVRGKLIKQINGWENIPKKGNFILASNHLSHADWFLCGYVITPRKFTFVGQVDKYNSGFPAVWRRLLYWYADVIPIDRTSDESKRQALAIAVEMLKKGYCVIIYPEGTRSKNGVMQTFKPGVGKLFLDSGVPVLPVGFFGSNEILPPGGKLKITKVATISIGKPLDFKEERTAATGLDPSGPEYHDLTVVVTQKIEDSVRALLGKSSS
jgi:1-acyl-sn-glycerol-3-phosphate acyltransferase